MEGIEPIDSEGSLTLHQPEKVWFGRCTAFRSTFSPQPHEIFGE